MNERAHPTNERRFGFRLLCSLIGAALAVILALLAAHYYAPPNLNGTARSNAWLELDSCLALGSALLALGVGIYAGKTLVQSRVLGAVLGRALLWLALTVLLAAAWGNYVSLLTLLIAPSHAFAGVRLGTLAQAWRTERLWRR